MLADMAGGIAMTLTLAGSGFMIGAIIGLPLVLARTGRSRALRFMGGAYIEICRGIPPIAWLFVLFFGVTQFGFRMSNVAAAILGLGIISSGYLAEIYRAGLRAVHPGQREAAHALALNGRSSFLHVIAPQALITVIPAAIAFFIGLLKDSAVASVIGVAEVTTLALGLSKRSPEDLVVFLLAGLVYLMISVPTAVFGRWLGHTIGGKWGAVAR